jgi:hypothetical protein
LVIAFSVGPQHRSAFAYEVYLEYDGQTTVVGPTSVVAVLYVRIFPSEPSPSRVEFRIDFDCVREMTDCVQTRGSAYAQDGPLMPFMFSPLTYASQCMGITCVCLANEWRQSDVLIPLVAGEYPLAYVYITRTGVTCPNGEPIVYSDSSFRVGCGLDVSCSGGNIFRLMAAPVATEETSWGAIKSLFN